MTSITLTETGTATDAQSVTAITVLLVEQASAVDSMWLAALAEHGSAVDLLAPSVAGSRAEQGTATDGLVVSVLVPLADRGSGADSMWRRALNEHGAATDRLTANVTARLAELGTAVDGLSVERSAGFPHSRTFAQVVGQSPAYRASLDGGNATSTMVPGVSGGDAFAVFIAGIDGNLIDLLTGGGSGLTVTTAVRSGLTYAVVVKTGSTSAGVVKSGQTSATSL